MENNSKNDSEDNNTKNKPNKSIDPLFNQIQEILIDQEMCQKKLIEQNDRNYIIELTIPGTLILKNTNVIFLLIIPKNYPKQEPELYCKTVFSTPHLCDGRNLLNNIINRQWTYTSLPLEFIINKIPKFIIKYDEYMDKSSIIGKYTLNHLYQINILKNLPIFFHLIPENNQIITIGDISLCIYDLEKENNFKFCKLTFFINIKEIIEIKSTNNLITIKYKADNNIKKINISSQDYITIENILKEKMKLYKKKEGKLPDIDIKYLEKEIEEKEKELLNKENEEKINQIYMYKEKCLRLMDLYQQAIEFYSAVNNPKYKDINIKIQQLIENTKLTSYLDKKEDEQKNKENIDKKEINENIKENKNINKNNVKKEKEIQKEEKIKEDKNVIKTKKNNNDNLVKKENEIKEIKKEVKKEVKKEEKKEEKKEIKKEEKKEVKNEEKKEVKKEDVKKEIKKEVKKEDFKKEVKKEEKKNENKNENKEIKENKNSKKNEKDETSFRLKIDEGELNTLDFGEEEEEEEDNENN